MIKTLRTAIATLLLLAAGNALALGLGQIEVKSRINEPLLAEIPIISTTPGELQALQARLASPDTFRRVGLEPPQGIAADLRFTLGNDAHGRPVIRVTTVAPVTQAVVNFLIEVDWGQGRLVREYSALVDAPRTASAPLQPAISAPVVAAPNVVQRPLVTMPVAAPTPPPVPTQITTAPLPPMPAPAPVATLPAPAEPMPAPMPAAEPAPVSSAVAPPPRAVVVAIPTPAPQPTAMTPSQYGPVKAGETLSKIASGLDQAVGYSLDQTMLALLRANPDAFLSDNINLLRQGVVLRVPGSDDRGSITADEAQRVVSEQTQQWRQARRPVLQPDAAVAGNAAKRDLTPAKDAAATSKPATAKPATSEKPVAKPVAAATPAKARQQAQARLEIVPAAVAGKATGTRSGTNAGGEGSMLQQQLQQRDEDLAARKAEISDLKERVAELENLKQQQAQLLTMKDSELAAAQQRLADARTATQPVKETQPHVIPLMPWLWGGLAVIGLALLAWLFARRRPVSVAPSPRRSFDSEALAASMRSPLVAVPPAIKAENVADVKPAAPLMVIPEATDAVIDVTGSPTTPAAHVEAPTWHSGQWVKDVPAPDPIAPAPSALSFAAPAARVSPEPVQAESPPIELRQPDSRAVHLHPELLPEPASAEQRMKLARAFLDIGDEHSARQLLLELLDGADPALRTDAAKLLRELG
ncbi:MAG: FimV/HubP family polar landmark protein [Thermomonas sp.]